MRAWVFAIALIAILSLAAACGNGDDEQDDQVPAEGDSATEVADTPTPEPESGLEDEPEPTATSEPEEPAPTATPAEEADSDPVPSPTPTETPVSTTPEGDYVEEPSNNAGSDGLYGLLLTLDDLPPGWADTDEPNSGNIEVDDFGDSPFDTPCGIEPLDEAFQPMDSAERVFVGTELGPILAHGLAEMFTTDDAESLMSYLREIFSCDEWYETDEYGDEIRYEIADATFIQVSDDTFAVRVRISFADDPEFDLFGDIGFDFVFIRRGVFVSTFWHADFFGLGDLDFESVVQTADEKLQAGT